MITSSMQGMVVGRCAVGWSNNSAILATHVFGAVRERDFTVAETTQPRIAAGGCAELTHGRVVANRGWPFPQKPSSWTRCITFFGVSGQLRNE